MKPVKIRILNNSGIPLVRFIGVRFDGTQFNHDLAHGEEQRISIDDGFVGLTAFRVDDEQAVATLAYPVSDELGFAAVLVELRESPHRYALLGEPFVIRDIQGYLRSNQRPKVPSTIIGTVELPSTMIGHVDRSTCECFEPQTPGVQ